MAGIQPDYETCCSWATVQTISLIFNKKPFQGIVMLHHVASK